MSLYIRKDLLYNQLQLHTVKRSRRFYQRALYQRLCLGYDDSVRWGLWRSVACHRHLVRFNGSRSIEPEVAKVSKNPRAHHMTVDSKRVLLPHGSKRKEQSRKASRRGSIRHPFAPYTIRPPAFTITT